MKEFKTLREIKPANEIHRNKFSARSGNVELVDKEDVRINAIKRILFIKDIFFGGLEKDFDFSPAKTRREAYFHQLGKVDELKRFLNITEADLIKFDSVERGLK